MSENSKKRTIKSEEIWRLSSSNKSINVIKVPSDVKFFHDTSFLVADSVGHGIFLISPNDNIMNEIECSLNIDNNTIDVNGGEGIISGYKYKKLFTEMAWPNCLVVLPDDKIRATDRKTKSIKTFDIETERLISDWPCSDEDNLGASQINGIAYSVNRKQTIVTDTAKNSIRIFNENGEQVETFCTKGDLLHHLRLPFYVTVDVKDHILVSDNMNYCVKIFDMAGNFINRIGSGNLFGNRQFQSPYGVAVSEDSDEIYVADHDSNKIFVYDKDGQFIGYAATGSVCESPCGVAVNEDCGLLVVTLSNPNLSDVKLFKIN